MDSLFVYVFFFAAFNFSVRFLHQGFPDVLGYATDIQVEHLLQMTNQKRLETGLQPLQINDTLTQAAIKKAHDMFQNNYWAHTGPQGRTPWEFISQAGYQYTIAGENLAKNFSTSQGVVDAWMASPSHLDNIVKSGYSDIGFAVVNGVLNGEETTLVVQMFGAANAPSQSQAMKSVIQEEAASPTESRGIAQNRFIQTELPANKPSQQPRIQGSAVDIVSRAFTSVIKKPLIHIPSFTRDMAFIFLGMLIGILCIDGWIVKQKRIVRVSGHNTAHILFFIAFSITLTMVKQGVLL